MPLLSALPMTPCRMDVAEGVALLSHLSQFYSKRQYHPILRERKASYACIYTFPKPKFLNSRAQLQNTLQAKSTVVTPLCTLLLEYKELGTACSPDA